jgi:hypothetical protein
MDESRRGKRHRQYLISDSLVWNVSNGFNTSLKPLEHSGTYIYHPLHRSVTLNFEISSFHGGEYDSLLVYCAV